MQAVEYVSHLVLDEGWSEVLEMRSDGFDGSPLGHGFRHSEAQILIHLLMELLEEDVA